MAKNVLSILRKRRDSLDRAIRALEELQELRFAVHEDSKDPAVGRAGAKVLRFCKELDRVELDQPPALPTGTDPGDD
ncbi:MAG: hypothetical protein ABSG52_00270 [Terriglobales bacterium]